MCQRLSEGERRGGGSDYRLPALAAQQPADSWLIKRGEKKDGEKKSSCSPTENLEILWQPADNFQLSLIDGVSPQ